MKKGSDLCRCDECGVGIDDVTDGILQHRSFMCRIAPKGCRVIDVGHSRVVEMRNGKRGIHEKAKNVGGGF